jgi:hypothetical protein
VAMMAVGLWGAFLGLPAIFILPVAISRQSLTSVDALLFGRPEVIVTFAKDKFDEKTLELKDEPTRNIVKQQLEAFAKFIERVGSKK